MFQAERENPIYPRFTGTPEHNRVVDHPALDAQQGRLTQERGVISPGQPADMKEFDDVFLDAEEGLLWRVAEGNGQFGQNRIHFSEAVRRDKSLVFSLLDTFEQWEGLSMVSMPAAYRCN